MPKLMGCPEVKEKSTSMQESGKRLEKEFKHVGTSISGLESQKEGDSE